MSATLPYPRGAQAPFVPGPLTCGRDFPLSQFSSGQPVISSILDWFVPTEVAVVTSGPQGGGDPREDGVAKETLRKVKTSGCFQPGDPSRVKQSADGDRTFKNGLLHTTPDFNVPNGTVFILEGTRYRVMAVKDHTRNGFVRYDLLEDYEPVA